MQIDQTIHKGLPVAEQQALRLFETEELKAIQSGEGNAVARLLNAQLKRNPHARFLVSDNECFSYQETESLVNGLAQSLLAKKVQSGQRVLLRGFNGINLALAWLAVLRIGAIAVTTMPLLRAKELREIASLTELTLCLCDSRLLGEWQEANNLIPTLSLDDFRAQAIPQSSLSIQGDSADIALIATTSGTTGKPKAVVHSHFDLLAACECWPRHVVKINEHDLVMGTPPLAFTFGLGGLLLFPLWAGAAVYLPDRALSPEAVADAFAKHRPTIFYTSPTFYRQLLGHSNDLDTSSLRLAVSAGEALPEATRQAWQSRTGIELIDGIGATEMFHIFISSGLAPHKTGALGKVVPGYCAKVVNEAGDTLPPGQIGRLAVQGPTGCQYYRDARQVNYVQQGWNYPGDAFSQDAEGYFYFHARADDMIITGGYNVGGPEVEDCLLAHAAVAECGVIGKPDAERGMIIKAFVVLKAGQAATTEALQTHVKNALAPYKYPREIEFVTSLPRTETGKLQRFALRKPAAPHQTLQPKDWAKAKGYANAVVATGKQIYVGGQIGWNAVQEFESDDFIAQCRQTLENIKTLLIEAGAGPEHMVRMTWYILDRAEYLARQKELGEAYRAVMGRYFPAMSCVVVAGLIETRAKVEIEVTAVL